MKNSLIKTKDIFVEIIAGLLILLFAYTATSKFLEQGKFVFQMHLAPLPLMKILAPILGWLVPTVEMIIAIALTAGMFIPPIKIKALYASIILLCAFEIYISVMLLSGWQLPCTCGGIISTLSWKQHLFFNAFFILTGTLSIKYLKKHKTPLSLQHGNDKFKELSRA